MDKKAKEQIQAVIEHGTIKNIAKAFNVTPERVTKSLKESFPEYDHKIFPTWKSYFYFMGYLENRPSMKEYQDKIDDLEETLEKAEKVLDQLRKNLPLASEIGIFEDDNDLPF